ncbi:MAG TPA: 30S ribosomal protein S16 [Polyangiaceae bacterium]|nr:30S ribosomal protein S16 [Polyangiaceae bacterium]
MAVHIRLSRYGTKKAPFYRIVVTDHRSRRDGKFIENIGTWNPLAKPEALLVDKTRLEYWTGQGALPSHTLTRLLRTHKTAAAPAT